ncbi:hypothetical protein AMECASPLE_025441 [Ameca splendens]|uniref:Uncharacterized protein n=1 Tax=Ameca splendens TaxID=208324 RepID=A0ABV0XHK4_9TELE
MAIGEGRNVDRPVNRELRFSAQLSITEDQHSAPITAAAAPTEFRQRAVQDTFMRTTKSRHVTSPCMVEPGSHPGARPGVGTCWRAPGGGVSPRRTRLGQA